MVVFAPKFNEKYTKAWAHPTRGQEATTTFFCRIASFFLLRLNIFIALWDHILRHTIWNLEFTRKPTTFGWNSKSVLEGQGFTWKRLPIYSKEPVFRIMVGRNQKIQYLNCSTLDVIQSFLIWLNILTTSLTVEDDFCIVLLSRNPIINPPPFALWMSPWFRSMATMRRLENLSAYRLVLSAQMYLKFSRASSSLQWGDWRTCPHTVQVSPVSPNVPKV